VGNAATGRDRCYDSIVQLTDLLLIVSVLGIAALVVVGLIRLVQHRTREARRGLGIAAAWAAAYAIALVATGAASRERALRLGEAKCFDEWCAALVTARAVPSGYALELRLGNRGRSAQAPDRPHAWLVLDGRAVPVAVAGLDQRVAPGADIALAVTLAVPREARAVGFVVTEGGGPSRLVIGDENSPLHAWSVWRLPRD
jgi:hypothetical protein